MKLDGMHCLVTGGAGTLGSNLVDELMLKDCKVRVLDNLANGKLENLADHLTNENFQFYRGTVTDPLDVKRVMDGIDVVFHLSCLGVRHSIIHPYENHRVNAEGTLLVLDAAYHAKVKRFVYCSTSEVYGTAQYIPVTENHPTFPCTVYGASKLAGEAYARVCHRLYGMPTVILRPFNIYGPRSHHEGDAGEFIPKSIVRALNGQPIIIFGDGTQTRDFTYVKDTVRAFLIAAESDDMIGQTLNVGSNFEISIKELARKIAAMVSKPSTAVIHTPERPGDVLRLHADYEKFNKLCGWKPMVDLETGLTLTIEHFRNHPLGTEGLLTGETGRNWEIKF
jgi:UDP-glucose 4-epimerase